MSTILNSSKMKYYHISSCMWCVFFLPYILRCAWNLSFCSLTDLFNGRGLSYMAIVHCIKSFGSNFVIQFMKSLVNTLQILCNFCINRIKICLRCLTPNFYYNCFSPNEIFSTESRCLSFTRAWHWWKSTVCKN